MRPCAPIGAAIAAATALLAANTGCGTSAPPAPAAPAVDELAGVWVAQLRHNGQTGRFAVEMKRSEEGKLETSISLPDVDMWDIPTGPATIDGDRVAVGPLELRYDRARGVLSGNLPEAIVPVHEIQAELHKVAALERPEPARISAPEAGPVWTHETGGPVWGGVAHSAGVVYAGSDDGTVHALEASTGNLLWRFVTGGAVRARPVLDGGSVLIHSDDGFLYRLDASTGDQQWRVEIGPALDRLMYGDEGFRYESYASAPAVDDGVIFIGHDDGSVHALDAVTGDHRWEIEVPDAVTSSPAISAGRVFFGCFDGKIRAVEAATGDPVWERDTGAAVPSSPALHEGLLIVGSRSYDLLALEAATGAVAWKHYNWFSWVESSATIEDGVVYVGSSDAQVVSAIDASDGGLLWSFDTGGSAWGRPAVSDDAVFLGSVGVAGYSVAHRGGFFAIDRRTGRGLWWFDPPRPDAAKVWGFASSPATGEGLVFAGGLDGRIYAFREAPAAAD